MKPAAQGTPLTLKRYLERLLLILVAGMLVVFLVPGAVSVYLIRDGITRRQNDRIFGLQTFADDYLRDRIRDLFVLAEELESTESENKKRMTVFLNWHPRFLDLYLTNTSGKVICDAGTEYSLVGMDLSTDPLFYRVEAWPEPVMALTSFSLTSRKSVLTLVVPVLSGDRFRGALFAELDLAKVQNKIMGVARDSGGVSFIVDSKGTLVIHPDFEWVQQQPNMAEDPFVRHGRMHQGHSVIYKSALAGFNARPVRYIGSSRLMGNGWLITTIDPLDLALRPLLLQILVSTLFLLLLFVVMLLILVRYTRRLVSPLEQMVRYINRIRSGEYRLEKPAVVGLYELDLLTLSFVNMSDAVYERDRWLEERVRERTAELLASREKESEANKAKSLFLANVSHELRTPLNAILGFSQVLAGASNLTDVQRGNLDTVIRNGERLLRMINEVIELSRYETRNITVNRTPIEIRELIRSVTDLLFVRGRDKGLELITEIDRNCPPAVKVDAEKLHHILINLLDNGLKYTERGSVTLRCRYDKVLIFEVEDTGPGIPDGIRERLFDLFYRSEESRDISGSGLGLPIVRQSVEILGGTITIEKAPAGGALFLVRIPAEALASSKVETGTSPLAIPPTLQPGKALHRPESPPVVPSVDGREGFNLFTGDPVHLANLKKNLRLGDVGGVRAVFSDSGHIMPPRMAELLADYCFNEILEILEGKKGR